MKNKILSLFVALAAMTAVVAMPMTAGAATPAEDFEYWGSKIYEYRGTDSVIEIPEMIEFETITEIGTSAFQDKGITSISMPSVTTIGDSAFAGCIDLTSVYMPNVTSLGIGVFGNCSGLESIDMPNVTSLEASAFDCCYNLSTVSMPKVETIGHEAFHETYGLRSITVSDSLKTVADSAFSGSNVGKVYCTCGSDMEAIKAVLGDSFEYEQLAHNYVNDVCTVCGEKYDPVGLKKDTDSAYLINSEADFMKFVDFANDSANDTTDMVFKLTSDIALTSAFDGIGARDMKDTLSSGLNDYVNAKVFKGTFDGGNHTISGVILKTGDYIGFFNSCYGATIKNLSISLGNETGWSDSEFGQAGAVFVGVSVDTTIENCKTVVAGDNDTFKASKMAAGFVAYAAHGTVIKDCVNNLNICSGSNEKAGGLVLTAQAGKSTGDGIVIDGCTNNGDIKNGSTNPFLGGLFGYADIKVTLAGEIVVSGEIIPKSGYAKSIGHVQKGSIVIEDGANITVPSGCKTVTDGKAVDGLFFGADNMDGTATLVKNSALAAGGSYKVMATGGKPEIKLGEGEPITIDISLATIDDSAITNLDGSAPMKFDNANLYIYIGIKVEVPYIVAKAEAPEDVLMFDGIQSVKDMETETFVMRFFWTIGFNGNDAPTSIGAYFFDWAEFDAASPSNKYAKIETTDVDTIEDGSIFFGTITGITNTNKTYFAIPLVNDKPYADAMLSGTVSDTNILMDER